LITFAVLAAPALAVSVLWLDEADYGRRDETIPGLSTALWGQFYLDSFATVDEAVKFTEAIPFQLVPINDGRGVSQLHLALADATGDSAVIEYANGRPRIFHGRKSAVMTNSPPMPDQLKNLARYRGFGGERRVPTSVSGSGDRFD
jgi:choloylglycine hydrolase